MSIYSQIYIQVVFAVRNRESLIHPDWEEELHKYIAGIIRKKGQKLLAINGMPDHLHFVIGMQPTCVLSDLVREIKKSSNAFVNDRNPRHNRFSWQEGFGAFTYSRRNLDTVIAYVMNQKEHHRRKAFREEFLELLEEMEVEPDQRYLNDWFSASAES